MRSHSRVCQAKLAAMARTSNAPTRAGAWRCSQCAESGACKWVQLLRRYRFSGFLFWQNRFDHSSAFEGNAWPHG
ncbi:hypothetical protein D3C84_1118470 [compost metagenome]